ncbi:MAG TPA: hypothetical protein VNL97_02695 [Solirubrobacterales bacterium]|nr:hypothetical protein [Solirubrobacterales bacterium]
MPPCRNGERANVISLGRLAACRVVGTRYDDADQAPVLVVEEA